MTEQEVIQEIVRLYESEDGFLTKLRLDLEFNDVSYYQSIALVKEYIQLRKGQDSISKRVALFLFHMVTLLDGMIYQLRQINSPLTEKTIKAKEQFVRLSEELFDFYNDK